MIYFSPEQGDGMAIEGSEIEAVKRVLTGEVSRAWAAENYRNPLRLMVAVAIMQGAEVTRAELIASRGIYAELIYELSVQPAAPSDGWPVDDEGFTQRPEWHDNVADSTYFVATSAKQGFHSPQPRQGVYAVDFVGSEQFEALFDPKMRETCRTWLDEALKAIIARKQGQVSAEKRHKAAVKRFQDHLVKTLERHPDVLKQPRKAQSSEVEALVEDLQKLLRDFKP